MSMVSNFVQPLLWSRKLYSYTHSWTKLHNEVMSWIFGAYECHYAWPLPEANLTTVRGLTISSVSNLSLSVMVRSAFSRAIVMELDSEGSVVSTFTRNNRAFANVQIWNVHAPLYPFVQFKFSVYGLTYVPDIHVYATCNAVMLVWGSLRLVPIMFSKLHWCIGTKRCT